MARPSAWGQAITSTVMNRISASWGSPHQPGHERDQTRCQGVPEQQGSCPVGEALGPRGRALGVRDEALNAGERRVVADRGDPAPDRGVGRHCSGDDRVAERTPDRVGPPVIIDSSRCAEQSTISPSAGIRPPGRTITTSPVSSSVGATATIESPTTFSASSGRGAASESRAEDVWASERISVQCGWARVFSPANASANSSSTYTRRPCRRARDRWEASIAQYTPDRRYPTTSHQPSGQGSCVGPTGPYKEVGTDPAGRPFVGQAVRQARHPAESEVESKACPRTGPVRWA